MKLLFCGKCFDIKAFSTEFTPCKCGNLEVRWVDPERGTFEAKAKVKQRARIIGMNNSFLYQAFNLPQIGIQIPGSDEGWRQAHDRATNAPGYLFDKKHRACWAGIFQIGQTADGKWAAGHEPYWEEIKKDGYTAYVSEDVHSPEDFAEFKIEVFDPNWTAVRQLRRQNTTNCEMFVNSVIEHHKATSKPAEPAAPTNVVPLNEPPANNP